MSIRSTSLKAFLIRFLREKGKPCYLMDIYKEISEKLGKKDCNSLRAQIRGILNASIKSKENLFDRINGVKGLYRICDTDTEIENYIREIEKDSIDCNDKTSREDALKIYSNFVKLAYLEANKMHGTSCIVPLEELHSACQIGLFKGAVSFKPSKAKNDGNSPIPYLKRCIVGSCLNTIRDQKKWNNRNLSISNDSVTDILKVETIDDLPDSSLDLLEEISLRELREILLKEMKTHLNEDEFVVMSKRWGLDNESEKGGLTFKEVGQELLSNRDNESSKAWAWQTEKSARNKLKKNSVILRNLYEHYGN
jgi:hypothetical protein